MLGIRGPLYAHTYGRRGGEVYTRKRDDMRNAILPAIGQTGEQGREAEETLHGRKEEKRASPSKHARKKFLRGLHQSLLYGPLSGLSFSLSRGLNRAIARESL
jgi:hypothetical protein